MEDSQQTELRALPSVDELLRTETARTLLASHPRPLVTEAARHAIALRRTAILDRRDGNGAAVWEPGPALGAALASIERPSLRRVVNATGVALHTNLGRAPLSARAIAAVIEVAQGYSNLEYTLERRGRGSRHTHLAGLLRAVSGAEDAVVVNNNAAAVLLVTTALATGREVIVSRGELIEIGGSFRIPDIIAAGGARLREVGTTNRTRLDDYRRAIGRGTAMLLKVHRSNFSVEGFTAEVSAAELATLGKAEGIPVVEDLGSGALMDLQPVGLPHEPTAAEQLRAGVDLVTFSGDKLLGGPQAGIVAGGAEWVKKVKSHPLMRAMRPDKMTLAALEATCAIYRAGTAADDIPTIRILGTPAETLRDRAERLAARLREAASATGTAPSLTRPMRPLRIDVRPTRAKVGGGALPRASLPSFAVALAPADGAAARELDRRLRTGEPPVVARLSDDAVLLDVRTLDEGAGDLDRVVTALRAIFAAAPA